MDGATEAASDAVEAVETAIDTATGDAAVAAEATGDAALGDIFTAEGFDIDQAIAALEAADLSPITRQSVITALRGAGDDPALLQAALDQARAALGLGQ